MNILFTCAGRRNYLINYFKEALENDGKIFAADMQKTAPSLIDADQSIVVPSIYEKNYIKTLLRICEKNQIDVIISLNDLELPILAENIQSFENKNIKVIISNKDVINICFDKWKTYNFINKIGLNSPLTYINYENAKADLLSGKLKFPLIIKPRWGSASIGIEIVDNFDELELVYSLVKLKVVKSILHEASKEDISHSVLIQEFIDGIEYGIDIVNNLSGEYCSTIVKQKLAMRAGETDKAITVDEKNISKIGKNIGINLKHVANLDCDIFKRDDKYFILELNSRFGGGYPFSHMAGANIPLAIIKWLKNENAPKECFMVKYNQMYSKYDNLMKISI